MIARPSTRLLAGGLLVLLVIAQGRSALSVEPQALELKANGRAELKADGSAEPKAAGPTEVAQAGEGPEPGAAAEPSQLAELADTFNSLLVQDQPIALSCVIGNGTVDAVTSTYHRFPFLRNRDGSYTSAAMFSVVYRTKGQPDRVQAGDVTVRITTLDAKPVMIFESDSYSPTPQDIVQLGNGVLIRERDAGQGEIESVEYLRQRDGSVVALQRYVNLATVVVYNAVTPPPELVKRAQDQVLQQAQAGL